MRYEINVSLHGHHFFATNERSITSLFQAKKVLAELCSRFTNKDGYEVSLTKYETTGSHYPNIQLENVEDLYFKN